MDVSFEQGRAHHVPSKFITDSIAIGWGDIPHFKKKALPLLRSMYSLSKQKR
jgi:hypothetical protein